MTKRSRTPQAELEDLLRRLELSREELVETLNATDGAQFESRDPDGESIKTVLERTADDVNFYYGCLAARALNLPQPPCLQKSEFMSIREATLSIQVAHRRFTNLLHDLVPADLDKVATGEDNASYTLRQVLEMAAAQYRLRRGQVQALSGTPKRRRRS